MGTNDRPYIRDNSSLNRTIQHCDGDICECLAKKIDELLNGNAPHGSGTKGLKQLFAEQTQKGASPFSTDPNSVWGRHDAKFRGQQSNLRDHLDEYDTRGCGGGGGSPVPVDARKWTKKDAIPQPRDWEANNAYQGLTGSAAGDTAVAAGTVGVGYVLYRGIRLLPSLFPAGWWSLPANLATP